jgi:tRNA modification GTPase
VDFSHPWRACLVALRNAQGEVIERGVAIPYRGPRSFTGEDMLEVLLHGSPYLVEMVERAFSASGARPAEPGEFTRRALANGKLDLVQAEAIRDLIAADSAWQARNAREQLEGRLSRWVTAVRGELTALAAEVEGTLDFGEHGVEVASADWRRRKEEVRARIGAVLGTASAGARIRNGVRMVILGPPNAGKSTLFNRLLGQERAIVSPHPGTTRDAIEAAIEVAGMRVELVDTAGLGDGRDEVEEEGMRRSRACAAAADVVLELWPADAGEEPRWSEDKRGRTLVRVLSKGDLGDGGSPQGCLSVSCVTGAGLHELRERLQEVVLDSLPDLGGGVAIGERHRQALERADRDLERCDPEHPELAAEGLHWALLALDELLGEVRNEEVLDQVFATFCIGK